MAFHVRNPQTEARVRALARLKGVGLTEAIDLAVSDVLKREGDTVAERLRRTQELLHEIDSLPRTGLKADKAFFDELSGD